MILPRLHYPELKNIKFIVCPIKTTSFHPNKKLPGTPRQKDTLKRNGKQAPLYISDNVLPPWPYKQKPQMLFELNRSTNTS